ncbi:MAG: hypothetical protein U0U66_07610 [Cytophagaceae bacterium]
MRNIALLSICLIISTLYFTPKVYAQGSYKGQGKYVKKSHKGPWIQSKQAKKNEYFSIYATTGFAMYEGDLCVGFDCMSPRPQFGIGGFWRTRLMGSRFSLRSELRVFRLYSNDFFRGGPYGRNLDFRSTNFEFWVGGQYDLYNYDRVFRRRPLFNHYVFGGIGFMTFNPYGSLNGEWHQLRPLKTQGIDYGSIAFMGTVGIGVKMKVSYKLTFMTDFALRLTTTDNMDDVSQKWYVDPSTLSPLAAQLADKTPDDLGYAHGRQRGNNSFYGDKYFMFNVGAIYTFTNQHRRSAKGKQHLLRK